MSKSEDDTRKEDSILWQKVIAGDQTAFEAVVQKYQTAVSSIAYSVLGNFSLAQEVTQESFWQAWRQRRSLASPEKLASWLCGIARHTAIQMLRQEKRQHSDTLSVAADRNRFESDGLREHDLIDAEEAGLIWSSIESMPENYRETLILFYREGQSVEEVARLLEISPEAVRQRLSRGREKLRDQMAEHVEDVLTRTRPGRASVRTIMLGIAALSAALEAGGAAVAAGTSSIATKTAVSTFANAAAKSGVAAGAGIAGGLAGGLLGTAGGLGGAWLGIWLPAQMAPTQAERSYLEREGRPMFRLVLLYSCLILCSSFLLFMDISRLWYFGVNLGLTSAFTVWIIRKSLEIGREVRRIRATVDSEKDPNPSLLRRKAQVVMGRAISYRSSWELFGMPLLDVQFGSPDEFAETRRGRKAAGWIACGDHATGLLFAYGGVARGLIAVGGLAIGGVALGGLTLGIVSVGGCGAGVFSLSGLAIGWDSAGGIALGYHSATGGVAVADDVAVGGFAMAREYAFGGDVVAREANTEVAKAIADTESLSWIIFWIANNIKTFVAIVLSVSVLPPLIHLWFRVKPTVARSSPTAP